jgi:hypothetical protein
MWQLDDIIAEAKKVQYMPAKKWQQHGSITKPIAISNGLDFREIRNYYEGDDVRHIDWNSTAKYGHTYIKTFDEVRQKQIWIIIDTACLHKEQIKWQHKLELTQFVTAVLQMVFAQKKIATGLLMANEQIQYMQTPKLGLHFNKQVTENIKLATSQTDFNIVGALQQVLMQSKQNCELYIISQFYWPQIIIEQQVQVAKALSGVLQLAATRHTLFGIKINHLYDSHFPALGLQYIQDAVTGQTELVDTSSKQWRYRYEQLYRLHTESLQNIFTQHKGKLITIMDYKQTATELNKLWQFG